MIKALNEKGFEKNSSNHWLIVNGDVFDRGFESKEVKDFLDSVKNKTCILGNHERLMLDAISRGEFLSHDLSNGTLDAAIQLTGGYSFYDELKYVNKASKYFNRMSVFSGTLSDQILQKKIISNLVKMGIVEWIVDNFYEPVADQKKVEWKDDKFSIVGKPRYYLQIGDKLMTHGFLPSPDWIKIYTNRSTLKTFRATLPDNFDLLDESTEEMWEEYGYGIWSDTPVWLEYYYKYKLEKLYDYLINRKIKEIYVGHWHKDDLINRVYSISMTPSYEKYQGIIPTIKFTDSNVTINKYIIVETFND
jgi:hypothetical protein